METNECFLCSQKIHGDADYFQFHLNHCLDNPFTSTSTSASTSADALLAQELAESINASAIEQITRQRDPVSEDEDVDEGEGCPFCGVSWNDLGVGFEDRNVHAEGCLTGAIPGGEDEFEIEIEIEGGNGGGAGWGDGAYQEVEFSKGVVLGTGSAKDTVEGVEGLIEILATLLERAHKDGKTKSAFLCDRNVEHVQRCFKDMGWGCGYKNGQMVYSALRRLPCYTSCKSLKGKGKESDLPPIPTIPEFQAIIEEAWKAGFDPDGRDHFGGKLKGRKKWIGTTEIYTALTFLGIRVKVVDFPKQKKGSQSDAHEALINWIMNYFTTPLESSSAMAASTSGSSSSSSSSKKRPCPTNSTSSNNAFEKLMNSNGTAITYTHKQPLYLQHNGHSRTVVGFEKNRTGDWLLIFDPSKPTTKTLRTAAASSSSPSSSSDESNKRLKSSPNGDSKHAAFWDAAPGVKQIWGQGHAGFGKAELDISTYPKLLEPYRVSLKGLSRNQEYQVMYVEEGPLLTQKERLARKLVLATVVK